jgi:diguanylate cyclase (GGDEF)-like protein
MIEGPEHNSHRFIKLLRDSSEIDSVTGLKKRGSLDSILAKKLEDLNRPFGSEKRQDHLKNVVIFALDLDDLKKWNEYGHSYGDTALRVVADALKSHIQDSDSVFRLGDKSDEIVAILSSTNVIPQKRIDEIKKAVNSGSIEINGEQLPVTASIAHIVITPGDKRSFKELLGEVDQEQRKDKQTSKKERIKNAKSRLGIQVD